MLHKRVFTLPSACRLLVLMSILVAISTPHLQTNASESEPEEAETSVNGFQSG